MQYYNYFTEVEDRFRLARNSGMFMMSPLDWVLVESWKDAGVPLAAVLKGIDRAFEKYHAAKRRRFSTVNSVAYCTQEVLGAARDMAHGAPVAAQATAPGFEPAALVSFFEERAEQLRRVASQSTIGSDLFAETARVLDGLAAQAQAHELWKDAGVPLAAVLKGIDRAFEKYHAAKRRRFSTVNSVAYCTQEVLGAARDMAHGAPVAAQATAPGFEPAALVSFFEERAEQLRRVASQSLLALLVRLHYRE